MRPEVGAGSRPWLVEMFELKESEGVKWPARGVGQL